MQGDTPPLLKRFVISFGSIALAIGLQMLLDPFLGQAFPFITVLLAIVLTAWYVGRGLSLVALGFGLVATDYLFVDPRGSLSIHETAATLRFVLHACVGIAMILVTELLQTRGAFGRLATAHEELLTLRESLEREIVDRKRAEELLRRYELLAGHSRDIVLFMNRHDGHILEANAAAITAYGYSREELLGMTIHDLRAVETRALTTGQMAVANDQGILFETVHRRKDGNTFPVEVSSQGALIGESPTLISVIRDISERKRTEQEQRRDERRLRLALESGRMGTWDWDVSTDHVEWSTGHYTLLGYKVGEVEATHEAFRQRVHPEDRPHQERALRESMDQREDYRCEYRVIWPDGAIHWLQARGRYVYNEHGTAQRMYGVLIDIDQQKQAEEALRKSEQHFRVLFDHSPDAVLLAEPEGRITEANPAACAMFGMTEEDLCRAGRAGITDPNDPRLAAGLETRHRTGYVTNQEVTLVRKNGEHFLGEVSSVILPGDGTRAFVIIRDITERKRAEDQLRESEQRFRVAQELSLDGFNILRAIRNDAGEIVDFFCEYANPATARLLGRPTEPLVGRRLLEVIPGAKNSSELFERYVQVVETGEPHDVELHYDADGISGWFRNMAIKLEHGIAVYFTDITPRKKVEEDLRQAKDFAEAASVAKSQFLANMSHELRTPMNAILGMIDVALPKATDPTVQDCLQTAKGSADLLLTLLNDLLDSAKIESGRLTLEAAPFSLRRMLDQVTSILSVRASEKGLAFYCHIPEETPDALLGDRMRFQQVLLNLAGNAIKFTERGEVEICVHTLSQNGGVHLEFSIRDTGIGIAPASLKRLFQPFAQADDSMTRRFGGTGLGLAIAKSLVEMMGGRIWVESKVDQGSVFSFTVRLPLAIEPPCDGEAPVVVPAAMNSLRILLAEDNPANQKLAKYILEDRGHTVEIAGDGHEALCLSEDNRYDVILMDLQMPGMDGLEATAAIRRREGNGRRVPIIAMTAHAMQGDRQRCLTVGMDAYLSKPIKGEELLALVERLATPTRGEKGSSHIAGTDQDNPSPVSQSSTPASPAAPSPSVFDPDAAVRTCFGKREMFQNMVGSLFDEAAPLVEQMRSALACGNGAELATAAHRLKGTVVYLAAGPATEATRRVERIGRSGELTEAAHALDTLERELAALKAAIAPYRP